MWLDRILMGGAVAALALLGGCGGGGGAAPVVQAPVTPAPPVPTPPVATTSGLVPDAGTAGAVLYADAAALRVLRDRAVWTYHGIDQKRGAASSAAETIAYTNVVKHASAGNGIIENGSNPFNDGADTSGPLRYESGAYKFTLPLTFIENGPVQSFEVTELRSPVKVNDQYVSIDRHIADSGSDFDGDKVNDAVDIALYSRVAGEEMLDLPNRLQVRAVRVDTTMRFRATFSKTGTATPLFESVQRIWYAPGIGIVKTRGEQPNNADPTQPNRIVTEELQNWDGISEGLGHLPVVGDIIREDNVWLSYPMPPAAIDAAGFDNHAVVLTPTADVGTVNLVQLDQRGNLAVQTPYRLDVLFPGARAVSEPRLLRVGGELRLVALTDGAISVTGFDATGQRITLPARTMVAAPIVVADTTLGQSSYRAGADASGIWLSWSHQAGAGAVAALALRRFDASGQPQGYASETVNNAPSAAVLAGAGLTVTDSRVVVSWSASVGFGVARRVQVVDIASGVLLADTSLPISPGWCAGFRTAALQPGVAVSCLGYSINGLRAARLNDNGSLQLPAGVALPDANITAPWLQTPDGNAVVGGAGGELAAATHQYGRYWPGDAADSHYLTVLQTASAGMALSQGAPRLLARIPGDLFFPSFIIPMGNRLMVIGANNARDSLRVVTVWRP